MRFTIFKLHFEINRESFFFTISMASIQKEKKSIIANFVCLFILMLETHRNDELIRNISSRRLVKTKIL